MSEYDDLFEKDFVRNNARNENNIDDFHKTVSSQKYNGILFLIYIIVNVLFTFGVLMYFTYQYPNTDTTLENITVLVEPDIELKYIDETINEADFTVTLKNETGEELQQLWVTVELFDIEDNSIGIYKFSEDSISVNGIYIIDERIFLNVEPVTFETNYGIDFSNMFYIILGTIQALTMAVLFIIVDRKSFKANWVQFKEKPLNYIGQIIIGFAIVFGSLIVASIALEYLGVTDTSQNEATIRGYFVDDTFRLVTLFFMLCVFTPIVEEVIFRKVVYNFFQPKLGNIVAILGTGIIFGLMHVISFGDFVQSIPYILMGIAFGYIYYRSNRNIYVVIGVHFINNFITYAMYVLILYGYYSL